MEKVAKCGVVHEHNVLGFREITPIITSSSFKITLS